MSDYNIGILCQIRNIYHAIADFENRFIKAHDLCLNEGMLLCTLSGTDRLSSGKIAEELGLSNSNASKVIRSVENKGLVQRMLGDEDKRQMYFLLTPKGKTIISEIKSEDIELPEMLKCLIKK